MLINSISQHLLSSEVIKEYFKTDPLKNLFANYERVQGKEIYWHNFYNAKVHRILFLLTFDIWHHFYIENTSLEVSPPCLSDYLKGTP